jgi:hypothetical protein
MTDMFRCDDKDVLVGYLYDEIDDAARRRVEEHLRVCPACAAEVAGLNDVRVSLASWTPPRAQPDAAAGPMLDAGAQAALAGTVGPAADAHPRVLGPARWWRPSATPAWARAAAAVLVAAVGVAIANLQVRYGPDGLVLTTGWMNAASPAAPEVPAAASASAPGAGAVSTPARSVEDWRLALAALEAQLREEIQSARGRQVAAPREAADPAVMRRVAELIEASEQRQKRELAYRLAQFGRDIEVQRRSDNRRAVQALGQFEALSGAEIARQRQIMDYIMRVSAQPPQ